jgi:hypothetical protein
VPPGSSLIEIDLIDQKGGTLVRLTHSGLPDAEECASHRPQPAAIQARTFLHRASRGVSVTPTAFLTDF